MRLKCPGCGTWLCDDEELNDDGDEVPIEMEHIAGGRWAVTEIVHTPARCRTASGYAALVDAARGVGKALPTIRLWLGEETKAIQDRLRDPDDLYDEVLATLVRERDDIEAAMDALLAIEAALGALR